MKTLAILRVIARIVLALAGVGVAGAVALSPGGGCVHRGEVQQLAPAADTTIRASALWRIVAPKPAPVVLPKSVGKPAWQLVMVRRVIDADTWEVRTGSGATARVRVLNVDAPESGQPFGAQATDSVRRLLGNTVWVLSAGGDAYGRTLAQVRLRSALVNGHPAGKSVDSLLVVRGWAWAYNPGSNEAAEWAAQQQQAQVAGRGLWKCGTARVVRPGVWRAYNKQEKASAWAGCPW